ncbi:MAG: hypothetical protein AAFO01_19140, partial [Pseudomonadota bacterium]
MSKPAFHAWVPKGLAQPLAFLAVLTALIVLSGDWRSAFANDLSPFVGSYVGRATVEDVDSGKEQLRDLDIVVIPHGA